MSWRDVMRGDRRWFAPLVACSVTGSAALLFVSAVLGVAWSPRADLRAALSAGDLDYGRTSIGAVAPLEARFIAAQLGDVTGPTIVAPTAPSRYGLGERAPTRRAVERHELTNDSIAGAREIPSVPFTARTQTSGATRQGEDPSTCSAIGGTAWYRYQADHNRVLVAHTLGSDHATALGVFEDTGSGLTAVGCDTDARGNGLVTFAAKSGRTYLFQAAAPAGGGNLVFNLDLAGTIQRVSIGAQGEPADDFSGDGSISDDGRYVAFVSSATNLVEGLGPEDTPCPARKTTYDHQPWPRACAGVWLRDLEASTTELISVADDGTPADAMANYPVVSADGRYVLFQSRATNLVPGDTYGPDLFVRDRLAKRTERIHAVSERVLSEERTNFYASISVDGRHIAFQTRSALVDDDENGVVDVYLYDRWTRTHERVSVSSDERQAEPTDQSTAVPAANAYTTANGLIDLNPYISRNGRYVVFRSNASNLVPNDRNGTWDTFVRDRLAGTTERVSVSSSESEGDGASLYQWHPVPTISDDGRYVVFYSAASNLVPNDRKDSVDVFRRDRVAGETMRVSEAWDSLGGQDQWLFAPSISSDGRFIHLESAQRTAAMYSLTAEQDSDVYRFDTVTSTLAVVTVSEDGADSHGQLGQISGDGNHIVFTSSAAGLDGETYGFGNAFVYEFPRMG